MSQTGLLAQEYAMGLSVPSAFTRRFLPPVLGRYPTADSAAKD